MKLITHAVYICIYICMYGCRHLSCSTKKLENFTRLRFKPGLKLAALGQYMSSTTAPTHHVNVSVN